MSNTENQNQGRRRFVFWFFSIGTLVPVFWLFAGFPFAERMNWDWTNSSAFLILLLVVWPTISMLPLDLDLNWYQFILAMLVVAPLNGVWYGAIGFFIWHVRGRLGRAAESRLRS